MNRLLGGFDIGGTKCAAVLGLARDDRLELLDKIQFPTPTSPPEALERLMEALERLLERTGRHLPQDIAGRRPDAVGISCGGPLDSARGLILSPPNLPGWDRIDVVAPVAKRFGAPAALQNDANACALAEWRFGAGRGTRNMIFLTFGTGMGAGLILNGRLYEGTNDMAGEVGHIRLEADGPEGYGKSGSFEGFCSGGGMAKLARSLAADWLASGRTSLICRSLEALDGITAKSVGEAAQRGDELALSVYRETGRQLGRALAVLIDILNPQKIVIGSIYTRQRHLLEPAMEKSLAQEVLPLSRRVCEIVPAELSENVGDMASLSVALQALERD